MEHERQFHSINYSIISVAHLHAIIVWKAIVTGLEFWLGGQNGLSIFFPSSPFPMTNVFGRRAVDSGYRWHGRKTVKNVFFLTVFFRCYCSRFVTPRRSPWYTDDHRGPPRSFCTLLRLAVVAHPADRCNGPFVYFVVVRCRCCLRTFSVSSNFCYYLCRFYARAESAYKLCNFWPCSICCCLIFSKYRVRYVVCQEQSQTV